MRNTLCLVPLLLAVPLSLHVSATDLDHSRRSSSHLDIENTPIKVDVYSDYSHSKTVVVDNRTNTNLRYVSAAGYIADIAPESNFAVPCASSAVVDGQLSIATELGYEAVYDDIYCNDYITLSEGQ